MTVLAVDVFIARHSKPSPQSLNWLTVTVPPFGNVTMARLCRLADKETELVSSILLRA